MRIEYESKVNKANSYRTSLKVIIPQGISKFLQLEAGDTIIWDVTLEENSPKIIVKKK